MGDKLGTALMGLEWRGLRLRNARLIIMSSDEPRSAPKKRKRKRADSAPQVPVVEMPRMSGEKFAQCQETKLIRKRMATLGWLLEYMVFDALEEIEDE